MGFIIGFLLSVFGYLLGSILFAKIIASYKGIDITSVGSKSAGGLQTSPEPLVKNTVLWCFYWMLLKDF